MKKLLLILFTPILLLTSCSKSGVTPQSLEGVIVGKKWILNNDVNGFYLSQNGGFYSTEVCGEDVQQGNWIIEDDLIKYRYYLNNSQEVTILYGQVSEYTSTQIKLVDSSDPNMTVNTVYNAFTEIYGCTDAAADNYNEDANCDDGSCSYINTSTYVPDDNFEQALINLGYDTFLDDYVITSNINTVIDLNLFDKNISDLTGIEDFTALTYLNCQGNQLTSLDVSNNIALTSLSCGGNQLTSLDVSNNTALISLWCQSNNLSSLDVSTNLALQSLVIGIKYGTVDYAGGNSISNLDISNNNLKYLHCDYNNLTSLDLRNQDLIYSFSSTNNSTLSCIQVDNVVYANENWSTLLEDWGSGEEVSTIDPHHYFSEDCSAK